MLIFIVKVGLSVLFSEKLWKKLEYHSQKHRWMLHFKKIAKTQIIVDNLPFYEKITPQVRKELGGFL